MKDKFLFIASFNKGGKNFCYEKWTEGYYVYDIHCAIKKDGTSKALNKFFNLLYDDKKNYHHSIYHANEKSDKAFCLQTCLAFDFDVEDKDKLLDNYKGSLDKYKLKPKIITDVLDDIFGVNYYTLVESGLGFHIYLYFPSGEVIEENQFKEYRPIYNELAQKIETKVNQAYKEKDKKHVGYVFDRGIFQKSKLLRIPGSLYNEKLMIGGAVIKRKVKCEMWRLAQGAWSFKNYITTNLTELSESFDEVNNSVKLRKLKKETHLSKDIDSMLTVDKKAVEEGCSFLKYCRDNKEKVTEPEWFAMIGVVGRLGSNITESRALAHEYSKGYSKYSESETDKKFNSATKIDGVRTCEGIQKVWKLGDTDSGCISCPHFNKVKSPVHITNNQDTPTQATGFWNVGKDKKGGLKLTTPNYNDLIKHFDNTHPFMVDRKTNDLYIYNNKKNIWTNEDHDKYPKQFMAKNMKPSDEMSHHRTEFKNKLLVNNCVDFNDFMDMHFNYINLKNGIYSFEDNVLHAHSSKFFFTHQLDFSYDPDAVSNELWDFLIQVSRGDMDMVHLLLEYMAYALTIPNCSMQKALVLLGFTGANGKSTFCEMLQKMAGHDSCTTIRTASFSVDKELFRLKNSLFNISEESHPKDFQKTMHIIKGLISGDRTSAREIYQSSIEFQNRCKLIFTCNEMPSTWDISGGVGRRFIILPFENSFDVNPEFIDKLLSNKAGIFNEIIKARKNLLERGHFHIPERSKILIENYMRDQDIVKTWVDHCISFSQSDIRVSSTDLYAKFSEWQEKYIPSQSQRINLIAFSKRIKNIKDFKDRYRRRNDSKNYNGIEFNTIDTYGGGYEI